MILVFLLLVLYFLANSSAPKLYTSQPSKNEAKQAEVPAMGPTPQMVSAMPDGAPEPKRKKLNPDNVNMMAAQTNQQLTHAQEMAEKVLAACFPTFYLSVCLSVCLFMYQSILCLGDSFILMWHNIVL